MRIGDIKRVTRETEVTVRINLDGGGDAEIDTGVGFLNHMLEQIAVHGLVDLSVTARGDLEVDAHHTIEDCAIALGTAVNEALGDRRGILRMAEATVPMDETLAQVVLDFSGRPYAVVDADFHTPLIGTFPTGMVIHFLESFAAASRATLHARVLYGRDDHHKVEALFKALARALRFAVEIDPRRKDGIASSKGTL